MPLLPLRERDPNEGVQMADPSTDHVAFSPPLSSSSQSTTPTIGADTNTQQPPPTVQTRNRRKCYLDRHPSYFTSTDLELADPLLYDRLIRRFQTNAEREAEGRSKGYSGVLEADLLRSEAKLDALANPEAAGGLMTYARGPAGEVVAEEEDELPGSRAEAYAEWRKIMEMRFIAGRDGEFDYGTVDGDEDLDDSEEARRDAEDKYFDDEEPSWAVDSDDESGPKELTGQTGIQDF